MGRQPCSTELGRNADISSSLRCCTREHRPAGDRAAGGDLDVVEYGGVQADEAAGADHRAAADAGAGGNETGVLNGRVMADLRAGAHDDVASEGGKRLDDGGAFLAPSGSGNPR